MILSSFYFIVPVRVFKYLIYNSGNENRKDDITLKDIWKQHCKQLFIKVGIGGG